MTIKPLITLPDPLLRQVSAPVVQVDEALNRLADDMLETMYDAPGIGLAAIQVGEPIRMLVVDVSSKEDAKQPMVFINPQILWRSSQPSVYEEGCLSIPSYYAEVERPNAVRVGYVDSKGKQREIEAHGLLSTCLQHEIDHLDGMLFIDHLSKLKRDMVIRRFKKQIRIERGAAI